MPARVAWVLRDPLTSEEYSWTINPKTMSTSRRKTMSYLNTAAPGGRVLAFEGRDEVRKISYSGTILYEEQYTAMVDWFSKRHQMELEDDLGQIYSVYIISLEVSRDGKTRQFPWRHTFSGEMLILDWT